ncbi:unnamed protein product [Rotaria socialis]|uniref:Uncharacterized protein n=1 Tax=Rotaria socialis TaxID=392032 RepID=A0A821FF46_9BILA|nr:unnamed protein product [Rotaria socialis]CAF3548408.1 unnamed protein product [Rotaria socialis]CAF3554555.1 unnamed protein product [Rotaria socialis]CAF3562714.1 unnamed protein product [Rotaria socialis]CAF3757756.1 unnamed protein product [Rotaria socialis]
MSLTPIRQYLVVADFLSGFKAREYSVYDPTGKNVTGKLQARITPFVYEADFEVHDGRKQKWSKGVIYQYWQYLFQLRTKPFTWVSKHDMEIYSNGIPDAVYLLGLAVKDGLARRKSG